MEKRDANALSYAMLANYSMQTCYIHTVDTSFAQPPKYLTGLIFNCYQVTLFWAVLTPTNQDRESSVAR